MMRLRMSPDRRRSPKPAIDSFLTASREQPRKSAPVKRGALSWFQSLSSAAPAVRRWPEYDYFFLVTVFLAAGFLLTGFFTAAFFAAGFFTAGFLTAVFLAATAFAGFAAAGFLTVVLAAALAPARAFFLAARSSRAALMATCNFPSLALAVSTDFCACRTEGIECSLGWLMDWPFSNGFKCILQP
ncbi:MAG: hypothetical protein EA402_04645 [Planctomycetota bacterium]|nr:MAG: hypothetical protein EA402_04645 [Planctomycetota bacterium]